MVKIRSREAALIHDLLMVPVAWALAYWFRFNLESPTLEGYRDGAEALLVVLPVQLTAFVLFGLYRGIWRFASLPDIFRIIKAVIFGVLVSTTLLFLLSRGDGLPRAVPVLYALFLLVLLGGARLLYRWLKDRHIYLRAGKRVLIVGAGVAGEMLVRDLLKNTKGESYLPIAFVDDKPRILGRDIHGVPVVGKSSEIPVIVDRFEIDLIMLAVPSADSRQMQQIVEQCENSGVPFRSVPELRDLVSGSVRINELREVCIDDLLGRKQVALDWPVIHANLSGKSVLVTGSGGSIGSELCRQISKLEPSRLILVDASEFNLYLIEMDLKRQYPHLDVCYQLGDVTDRSFINKVFETYKPQVVFHAAAYKHVPMLESQIRQALKNNVLGTQYVAEASDRFGVDQFVLMSTDKAVNPANIMGASKRAAEIFCQNLNVRSETNYITVRFGNVLGSAGSVIPLFHKQIAAGGPVTVTDPRMERFFMTISEACQLILQTVVIGKGGEIFVLDMGEPVKINYLAEQMIRLSGKEPGRDIDIVYTGLRAGEKLFEELFHEKEELERTIHEKVFLAKFRHVDWDWLGQKIDDLNTACDSMDNEKLADLLGQLVPEYEVETETKAEVKGADIVYLKT
ncbi:polysaccharide biosynthesis protein [Solemya velesiana gill symbiont]|uniref:Polysaccharide biosynthesis protein n=1 Tax=Solemya velesiana gill symbiont TaxID=1918948 RepID=A0A1T2KXY5_9GAMM|nr:nucleoside-diphosphate sugar epimerase/dehydratase [Solemya velesiana gill symbiont]OOZ37671.1 polysaccharide biosynthesis protein [Solemya velesiana gill symbiont]